MSEESDLVRQLGFYADSLNDIAVQALSTESQVRQMMQMLQLSLKGSPPSIPPTGGEGEPWVDIVDQMPWNPSPTEPEAWWTRSGQDIRGITIHHTLSHSPWATAKYCIETKGRPSLPYHFWVSEGGEVWLCVPLVYGMWHDHTGHKNVNISIGMAGYLHKVQPTAAQLDAAVTLVLYLMAEFEIPFDEVKGHCDRYAGTICPGWDVNNWRNRFYTMLEHPM